MTPHRAHALVLVVVVAVGLVGGLVGPAVAQPAQIDQLIQGPPLQGNDAPTIAERYPVTAYRYPFHGEGIGIGARSSEVLDQAINALASLLILGAGLLAQGASKLVQWAFDPTTTAWLLDAVDATITALGATVYGQALLAVAMLGALWIAWHAVARRQATTAVQGGIWMVAVIAFGVAFLAQPRWFIETPHEVTTELTASLFGAVAGVGTSAGDGGYHGAQPPTFSGPAAVDAQRQLEDQLWRVMVYEPWRIATFPSADLADAHAETLLADRSSDNVQDIYDTIREDDDTAAEFFAGREPLDRLVASGMTLLAALPIAVTMTVLGAALIVLQFAFVILSLLAPLFLLVGIHPGGGRNALLRWLDMWLGTLVKRVAVTGLISVLVALFAFASSNLSQQGWYLTVLLTTLVCVAALVYRKTITALLASAAGSVGAGGEGEREHRQRAHPIASSRPAARMAARSAIKGGVAGAAAVRFLQLPPEDEDEQNAPASGGRGRPGAAGSARGSGGDPRRNRPRNHPGPDDEDRRDDGPDNDEKDSASAEDRQSRAGALPSVLAWRHRRSRAESATDGSDQPLDGEASASPTDPPRDHRTTGGSSERHAEPPPPNRPDHHERRRDAEDRDQPDRLASDAPPSYRPRGDDPPQLPRHDRRDRPATRRPEPQQDPKQPEGPPADRDVPAEASQPHAEERGWTFDRRQRAQQPSRRPVAHPQPPPPGEPEPDRPVDDTDPPRARRRQPRPRRER
jgi:hypothetical protein